MNLHGVTKIYSASRPMIFFGGKFVCWRRTRSRLRHSKLQSAKALKAVSPKGSIRTNGWTCTTGWANKPIKGSPACI